MSVQMPVPVSVRTFVAPLRVFGVALLLTVLATGDAWANPELLNAHNGHRARHCAAPLVWSAQLAAAAQAWANRCTLSHDSSRGQVGENLAWGTNMSGKGAVDMWYAEVSKYNFTAPSWSNAVGHFTQIVWKASTQVGCAMASCSGRNYWVCRYAPPGNWNVNQPGVLASQVSAATCGAAPAPTGPATPPKPTTPSTPQTQQNLPGDWSAFATNEKGRWGFGVHRANEALARSLALNGCGGTGQGCKVFWTTRDRCVSFAESRKGGYWYAAGGGPSQDAARQNALRFCQSGTAPANSCQATGVWCR